MVEQADLFRAEVLEAPKMRLEGEVLLSRPLRAHLIIGLLTASVIGLAVWITLGRYARTEVARGQLVTNAETAKIIALHPGVVTRIPVVDGELVQKGQVLATVQIEQRYAQDARATQDGLSAIKAQQALSARQIDAARARGQSKRLGFDATITSSRAQYADVLGEITIQT
ncbi:biotin/lipoyl-binding protein [Sphingomonas sp. GlSt437]|uniref:HlyD family efflux transporter periplasmic adaptor subunit n=1 Tax=Sphingomonas sp. GlSt437 TaxID=3389970 RepID=UPI003A87E1BF